MLFLGAMRVQKIMSSRNIQVKDFSDPVLKATFGQISKNHGNSVDKWPEKVRANFVDQIIKSSKQSNLIGANKNA